ncbi:MAG: hypothetical protein HFH38_14775 [Lachnospiraceae bacterium]|nr:hypothetical protein [Lachnospiraceae bacterium]
MKHLKTAVIMVLCAALCLGYYYYLSHRGSGKEKILSEADKIITQDLENAYPKTARGVVKFYNSILKCYYSKDYTDEQLEKIAGQAWKLMDEELKEANPQDIYLESVKADIAQFTKEKGSIYSISMDGSNEVIEKTIEGRECAYIDVTYSMKGKGAGRSTQTYILRKDEGGRWRILDFYQL